MFSGERLRELRKERGLNREQVAEKVGVLPRTITFYETNGRMPSAEKLYALAEFFEVSLDYLFKRTDHREIRRG